MRAILVSVVQGFSIKYPVNFDDYAWEVECKGWLPDVLVTIIERRFRVTFYDATRLAQDVSDDLERGEPFCRGNVVVVQRVTREHMERAIAQIANPSAELVPECES